MIEIVIGIFAVLFGLQMMLIILLVIKHTGKKRRYKKLVKDIGKQVDVIRELEALSEKLVERPINSKPTPREDETPSQEKELPFSLLDIVFKKNFGGKNK